MIKTFNPKDYRRLSDIPMEFVVALSLLVYAGYYLIGLPFTVLRDRRINKLEQGARE